MSSPSPITTVAASLLEMCTGRRVPKGKHDALDLSLAPVRVSRMQHVCR